LDSNGTKLIPKEDCWHSLARLDRLRGAELITLKYLFVLDCFLRSLVNIVDLADFQEVVYHKTLRTHEAHWATTWHELALRHISAVKLKLKVISKMLFNVLNIANVSKTEMINLVREV